MLSLRSLSWRSLRYHWRSNLAVLLAAALSSAILTGALFVGDSLRGSLRTRAERQLNGITASWTGSRLIRTETASPAGAVPTLMLTGSLTNDNSDLATVPRVVFIGLTSDGFAKFNLKEPTGSGIPAILSHRVAEKLSAKISEKMRLSVQQLTNVPRSSILSKRSADATSTSATISVSEILGEDHAANDFSLLPNPAGVLNVFVPLKALQEATLVTVEDRRSLPRELVAERVNRVNALLAFGSEAKTIEDELSRTLDLPDWGLKLRTQRDPRSGTMVQGRELSYISVEIDRLLLEPAVVDVVEAAAKKLNLRSTRTTVYLCNDIAHGDRAIPYSLVAAVEANAPAPLGPFLPAGVTELRDDEIVLTDWPESPIRTANPGETITLRFFAPDVESGERVQTANFTLKGKLPLAGVAADPNLTPPFPGITDRLSIAQWNPPFTMDKSRIKTNDVNEQFWNKYRTTPKAYITRAAGDKWFSSRFGSVTSIRIAPTTGETPEQTAARLQPELRAALTPKAGGIVVESSRDRLLMASKGGTDFGGLFLGFSFFLIVSALLLVALMFRLNIERRAKEIGGLLAAGYTPRTVLRLLQREAMTLAVVGTLVGILVAVFYSRFLLNIITSLWPDPSVKSFLQPHTSWLSAILGFVLTLAMTAFAIWLSVRKLVRISPPTLLRGATDTVELAVAKRRTWPIVVCVLGAVASLVGGSFLANPDFRALSFFAGGSLLFLAGLMVIRRWLTASRTSLPSLNSLGFRNAGRSPGRSLLTVFLIGSATFLLVAVESFRRKPERDFADIHGGSGGFNLLVESDVPLFNAIDTKLGRDDVLNGYEEPLQRQIAKTGGDKATLLREAEANLNAITATFALRLVTGDDASCLNLYQAGRPRLLGVPDAMLERGGFRFMMTEAATPEEKANPWLLLRKTFPDGVVPVFAEQNTAMWMLKTMVGGTLEIPDENGRLVKCRLVGTLQDSVFQSELILADEQLRRLHPREEGFRIHLVQTPPEKETALAKLLATGLGGSGVSVSSSRERVAAYQSVVGTYLSTFQLLGALGLLLGLFGFAIVILRGVWERISELALLRAFGYTGRTLRNLLLGENLLLLALGVALGLVAAIISVLPHLALGGSLPWANVGLLLVGVLLVGSVVVVLTTANATRVPLLAALRKE